MERGFDQYDLTVSKDFDEAVERFRIPIDSHVILSEELWNAISPFFTGRPDEDLQAIQEIIEAALQPKCVLWGDYQDFFIDGATTLHLSLARTVKEHQAALANQDAAIAAQEREEAENARLETVTAQLRRMVTDRDKDLSKYRKINQALRNELQKSTALLTAQADAYDQRELDRAFEEGLAAAEALQEEGPHETVTAADQLEPLPTSRAGTEEVFGGFVNLHSVRNSPASRRSSRRSSRISPGRRSSDKPGDVDGSRTPGLRRSPRSPRTRRSRSKT